MRTVSRILFVPLTSLLILGFICPGEGRGQGSGQPQTPELVTFDRQAASERAQKAEWFRAIVFALIIGLSAAGAGEGFRRWFDDRLRHKPLVVRLAAACLVVGLLCGAGLLAGVLISHW